ncbi:hypothetical protein POM88_006764 [Heracleum sosnowskyi]|uniref:Uncharacterized protein n=1 Tax=Heracleum sosnowskyi TaxID=360622 RepID=A0AAD8N5V0_9APIA|nr:hypothetical protein POM88_006764 [Heracleum sosnowskyi]
MNKAHQDRYLTTANGIKEVDFDYLESKCIKKSVKQIATISTQVDYIQQTVDENQWFNDQKFAKIEGGMEHLNEGMKHLYYMIKNSHQPNVEQRKFFEGDDDDEDADDKDEGGDGGDGGAIRGRSEQGDFEYVESEEAPEDIFGDVEVEEEADWEEEPQVDPAFEAVLLRQKADLKRREEENAKVSDIISKHLVIQKAEHQEKQRLHNLKVKDRKLNVRLKLGEEWDKAREIFAHQTGTNNDGKFLNILERYKKINPDNTVYMKALHAEISRITIGFDRVREELKIYIYTHNEGTFIVSLNLLESGTLSELWVFMCKVKSTSPLAELLHDQLRDFAMKVSPQMVEVPYEVKLYKGRALQTCGVDPISLKDFPAKHLVYLENMLRTSGFATQ